MSNDIMKVAVILAVAAPVFATGLQNRWFQQGAEAFHSLNSPQGAAQRPVLANGQLAAAPQAAPVTRSSWGVVELSAGENSHYFTDAEVGGSHIRTVVDTGASYISLRAEDARALNIDPPPDAYKVPVGTANGTAYDAFVRLPEVRVGSIVIHDVDALVAPPGAQTITLLGMSFLKKLSSFQVADGRFVMRQ
jgi:aspartyl protease family protein